MKNLISLGSLLAALALLGGPAQAASPDFNGVVPQVPIRYGVRLLMGMPKQALQASGLRTGYGVGVFAETDLDPGRVVETRFDFLRYPQTNNPQPAALQAYLDPEDLSLAANSLALGIDVRQYLPRQAEPRWFLEAGLEGIRYEFQTSTQVVQAGPTGQPVSSTVRGGLSTPFKLGLAVGLGCDLGRNWTFALRYTHLTSDGANLDTLETGLGFRF